MFIMDVPPDVPPLYAPIVVAEAKQLMQASQERTIGVCKLIDSQPEERLSAVNSVDVLGIVWGYLGRKEGIALQEADFYAAKMTLLQPPQHGVMSLDEPTRTAGYAPNVPNFDGDDQATFLVEMGGYKVTVKYFIKVMQNLPGSGAQGSPYDDTRFCPNGHIWKISFDENDLTAPIYTFEHPYQLTSALDGYASVNLNFADLPSGAVGQTTGTTIILDDTAAGHSWFIDTSVM